jgi:hypothetical protein
MAACVKGEDGNLGTLIDLEWPNGESDYFELIDEYCSIIRVDVETSDAGTKSVYACNCFRDDNISHDCLIQNMETLLEKMYAISHPANAVIEEHIRDVTFGMTRLKKSEGGTELSALSCTHIECIKALLSANNADVLNISDEYVFPLNSTESDNRNSVHLLKDVNENSRTMNMHVNLFDALKQVQFCSLVELSAKFRATCKRPGHMGSTTCLCKRTVQECVNIPFDDDEDLSCMSTNETDTPWSYKPRPWVLIDPGNIHSQGHVYPFIIKDDDTMELRKIPEKGIPTLACTCEVHSVSSVKPLPCFCRVGMKCGKCNHDWGVEELLCPMDIHSKKRSPTTIDVYYRKCTGVNCTEELHYDGVEDGLTVMYMQSPNTMGKRLIAVDALLLNEFINNIHDSSGTLTELIRSINQGYAMEDLY